VRLTDSGVGCGDRPEHLAGRTDHRRLEPVRGLLPQRRRGQRGEIGPAAARLVAVDLLHAEHIRVQLGDRRTQPRGIDLAVVQGAPVHQVERNQPHERQRYGARHGVGQAPAPSRPGVIVPACAPAWHDGRMQVSARGDYAVRAALGLAAAYPNTVSAQALAEEQSMPRKFLEAILADLRRADLVRGLRGVDGGYVLTRPPAEISVGQVLRAVDGPLAAVRGLRPEDAMYEGTAAHLQQLWVAVRAAVRSVLDEVSLADLVRGRLPAHVRRLTATPDAWQSR
jgi:Rrf2 family protein